MGVKALGVKEKNSNRTPFTGECLISEKKKEVVRWIIKTQHVVYEKVSF